MMVAAFIAPVFAEGGGQVADYEPAMQQSQLENPTAIKIFPNPATEYIELSENNKVAKILVFSLTGREMKRFDAYNGEKYYIGDLASGLYLVQLLDNKNKTIVTQRVSKR